MPAKAKSTTKAKKKSTTQAPATKDKKRSKIPIEFVDKNHPWLVENDAWIDAHANEDEDNWTKDVLEKCSKEFSKLDEKSCNQKKLLELLWDVSICEETYSSSLPHTSMTLEGVRQLQQELTEATEKIIRLNIGIFELILSYNKDLRHLLDLPEFLRQYVKESRLLTEGCWKSCQRKPCMSLPHPMVGSAKTSKQDSMQRLEERRLRTSDSTICGTLLPLTW